jgi:hypothetical protein
MITFIVVERMDLFSRRGYKLENLAALDAHARLLSLDYVPQNVVMFGGAASCNCQL